MTFNTNSNVPWTIDICSTITRVTINLFLRNDCMWKDIQTGDSPSILTWSLQPAARMSDSSNMVVFVNWTTTVHRCVWWNSIHRRCNRCRCRKIGRQRPQTWNGKLHHTTRSHGRQLMRWAMRRQRSCTRRIVSKFALNALVVLIAVWVEFVECRVSQLS